jgi:hypothetical protein
MSLMGLLWRDAGLGLVTRRSLSDPFFQFWWRCFGHFFSLFLVCGMIPKTTFIHMAGSVLARPLHLCTLALNGMRWSIF